MGNYAHQAYSEILHDLEAWPVDLYNPIMGTVPLILVGQPVWEGRLATLLADSAFILTHYEDQAGYVSRLAADQPALIIIDGQRPDARYWITTASVSPATRRIPVVVVTDDSNVEQMSVSAGASFTVSPDDLEAELPAILAGHARIQPEADRQALLTACGEPLPPQALEAIQLFNAGEYYHQHDLLEALWMEEPGPERNLYQAVLQVGIAYFQVTRGNRRGALKMLLRARQWLAVLPDNCRGVDVARLREDSQRVQSALEAITDVDIANFDRSLIRPVVMTDS